MENMILKKKKGGGGEKEKGYIAIDSQLIDHTMHFSVSSSERKCVFKGKVNTLSAFIQVLDIDFLRIRGLINASYTL